MKTIHDLENDYSNLYDILKWFNKRYDQCHKILHLKGKSLADANAEQSAYAAYYSELRANIKIIYEFFEMDVKRVRGELYKNILDHEPKDIPDRGIHAQVDANPKYVQAYKRFLDVKEVYEKYIDLPEKFKQRAFSLRNLTDIAVNELRDYEI